MARIVKGHPGYSGAILTNTYLWVRDLGWRYLEKLAQQNVMQVQLAADPPEKIAIGERAVMADGNDYSLEVAKLNNQSVEVVHPTEARQ
jgi:iron(III) transport system substrate-binding protein